MSMTGHKRVVFFESEIVPSVCGRNEGKRSIVVRAREMGREKILLR